MYKIVKNKHFDSIFVQTNDIKVELIDYGATIKQIQSKDHNNQFQDVLLEYKNEADYLSNALYLNTTIGPIAGRVRNGEIKTSTKHYQLDKNENNKHALHSSNLALSHKKFDTKIREAYGETNVVFSYIETLIDNQTYIITVTYTIKENQVKIHHNVHTNFDFFFNLTNHAYFNLSGNLNSDIEDHIVTIHTNKYHKLDTDLISTHQIVQNTLYDFTEPKRIKSALSQLSTKLSKGFDDIYFFPKSHTISKKATVYEPNSKRALDIYSTYDHMVFYTHNTISDKPLKHLNTQMKHYGLCFECQKSPHNFTHQYASNTYLKANQDYNDDIIFMFSVME